MKDFVTEDEAKKRLCPYKLGEVIGNWNCEGALCMGWRWSHQDAGPLEQPTGFCGPAGYSKYY